MRRKLERVEGDVASDRGRAAQSQLRLAADDAGKRWVGEGEAAHRGLTVEGDPRRFLDEGPVRHSAEGGGDAVERALLDMNVARVERAFDRRAQFRPGDRGVEVELADLSRARDRAGVDLDSQYAVCRSAAFDVEPGVGGDEMQAGRGDGGIVAEHKIALEGRLAREDRADYRRRHLLELGIEIEGQLPRRPLPRDDDVASRPDIRSCGEVELGVEMVERPRPIQGELDRRQARKIDEMGEKSARRLLRIDGEGELLGGGHVGHHRLEVARRVKAFCSQAEIEALRGRPQRCLAVDLEARRDADDRLAERQLLQAELLDDHLERQLRQDRPSALRPRRLGAKRPAQDLHVSDGQLVDLESPAEQGEPVPDEPHLVNLEPWAIAVGKDNVADRGVGGQRPLDRADRDARRLRGQSPRQQIGEDAPVRFGRADLPAERDSDDDRRDKPEKERTPHHQKDCPMLTYKATGALPWRR